MIDIITTVVTDNTTRYNHAIDQNMLVRYLIKRISDTEQWRTLEYELRR